MLTEIVKKIKLSGEEANMYKFMTGKVSADEAIKYIYDNLSNDVGNSKYLYNEEIQDKLGYRAKVCLCHEGVDIFKFYKDKIKQISIKDKKRYPEVKIIKYKTNKYNIYIQSNPHNNHFYNLVIDPIQTDLTEIVKKIQGLSNIEKLSKDIITKRIDLDGLLSILYKRNFPKLKKWFHGHEEITEKFFKEYDPNDNSKVVNECDDYFGLMTKYTGDEVDNTKSVYVKHFSGIKVEITETNNFVLRFFWQEHFRNMVSFYLITPKNNSLNEIVKKIKLSDKEKFNRQLITAKNDEEKIDMIYNHLKQEQDSGAYVIWGNDLTSNNSLYTELIHIIRRIINEKGLFNKNAVKTKNFIITWSYEEGSPPQFFIKEQ